MASHSRHRTQVSDSAKDLVSKLLTTNPQQRLTAAEAMVHPWMQPMPMEVCSRGGCSPCAADGCCWVRPVVRHGYELSLALSLHLALPRPVSRTEVCASGTALPLFALPVSSAVRCRRRPTLIAHVHSAPSPSLSRRCLRPLRRRGSRLRDGWLLRAYGCNHLHEHSGWELWKNLQRGSRKQSQPCR